MSRLATIAEATYGSVADLRAALTSDDADRRSKAYSAVLKAGIEPTDVLSNEPPEDDLEAAGVVPEGGSDYPSAAAQRQEIIGLLRELAGDSGGGE